eukprot:Rhum_TRINITY_DN14542_c26_g1::Rhum_TRINITY_DN14542_c26_g1_i1::g.97635::m.97635
MLHHRRKRRALVVLLVVLDQPRAEPEPGGLRGRRAGEQLVDTLRDHLRQTRVLHVQSLLSELLPNRRNHAAPRVHHLLHRRRLLRQLRPLRLRRHEVRLRRLPLRGTGPRRLGRLRPLPCLRLRLLLLRRAAPQHLQKRQVCRRCHRSRSRRRLRRLCRRHARLLRLRRRTQHLQQRPGVVAGVDGRGGGTALRPPLRRRRLRRSSSSLQHVVDPLLRRLRVHPHLLHRLPLLGVALLLRRGGLGRRLRQLRPLLRRRHLRLRRLPRLPDRLRGCGSGGGGGGGRRPRRATGLRRGDDRVQAERREAPLWHAGVWQAGAGGRVGVAERHGRRWDRWQSLPAAAAAAAAAAA